MRKPFTSPYRISGGLCQPPAAPAESCDYSGHLKSAGKQFCDRFDSIVISIGVLAAVKQKRF